MKTSFSLSNQALDNLETICRTSGVNKTAAVEMALAALAKGLTKMDEPLISRYDSQGEWPGLLPGKTVYKWQGKLWTGVPTARGYNRGIALIPLTQEDRDYLIQHGALPK